MDKAKLIEIADAVVLQLTTPGAPGFSQPFTPERGYQPTYDLKDLKTLKVSVVPKGFTSAAATRGAARNDYQINIGVQKKATVPAELDALMLLVQEIADFLRGKRLAGCNDAPCLSVENDPVFVPEHLDELGQFTSVLTLTYRATR